MCNEYYLKLLNKKVTVRMEVFEYPFKLSLL